MKIKFLTKFISLWIGERRTITDLKNNTIYLNYYKEIDEDDAFRVLVYELNHEMFHLILKEEIDKDTSKRYDNIALELECNFLYPEIKGIISKYPIFRKVMSRLRREEYGS